MNKYHQYVVFISQVLIVLAMEMVNPFIPTFVQQLNGGSIHDIAPISALIIIAPMLGMILMAPVWGLLGDKYGYKPMLIRAALALIIMQCLVSFASSVLQLLILRFLQGCFSGFIAAMQTYAVAHGEADSRARILARLQSAKAIGTAFGGSLGGLSMVLLSLNNLFQVAALLCVLPLILIIFCLPNLSVLKEQKSKNTIKNFYSPGILTISILIIFSQIAKFLPNPVFSLYVEQILHGNPRLQDFYILYQELPLLSVRILWAVFLIITQAGGNKGKCQPIIILFFSFWVFWCIINIGSHIYKQSNSYCFYSFWLGVSVCGTFTSSCFNFERS